MRELLAYKDATHLEILEVMMQCRVNFLHIKMIVQFARLAIQGDDGGMFARLAIQADFEDVGTETRSVQESRF